MKNKVMLCDCWIDCCFGFGLSVQRKVVFGKKEIAQKIVKNQN